MNEIRIRERTFLLGLALISFVIFYLLLVDRCDTPTNYNSKYNYNAVASVAHRSDTLNDEQLPFVVYAVTPTYARPVQKAELTRYFVFVVLRCLRLHNN